MVIRHKLSPNPHQPSDCHPSSTSFYFSGHHYMRIQKLTILNDNELNAYIRLVINTRKKKKKEIQPCAYFYKKISSHWKIWNSGPLHELMLLI
uniref:Uncharacterized protein n=1 Tax=Rhizophora mucronata TaxID=61149 RepID=A0A2P2JVX5_RHIMU